MSTDMESEDIVLVPVPTKYLPDVYRALAVAMGQVDNDGSQPGPEGPRSGQARPEGRPGSDDWTQAMVVRLNRVLHLDGARGLLDALATVAPQEVALAAGAELAGITSQQMAGQLAGLTRRCKKEFDRLMGPYHVRYDEMGKAFYWMAEDVAAWWRGGPDTTPPERRQPR
jgi:hypothetical protein